MIKKFLYSPSLFHRFLLKKAFCGAIFILIIAHQNEVSAEWKAVSGGSVELMSGFVSAAFTDNRTRSESGFFLNEAEVDFIKVLPGRAALRLDLNFTGSFDGSGRTDEEDGLSVDDLVEQGYISLTDGNHSFLLGKFNAPLGVESPDPPDIFQISHSMIYEVGLPISLTGLWVRSDLGTMDFSLYVVNGWNNIVKDSKNRAYGGRAGFKPDDFFDLGISYIAGDTVGRGPWSIPEKLWVFDFDMKVRSGESIMAFEYTRGLHENNNLLNPGEDDARWYGFLFMTYMELSPGAGLSFMYDVFSDDDGSRFTAALKETRRAYTLSPSLVLPGGPILRMEYRVVTSSENVFEGKNNSVTNRERVLGVEVLYDF